MGCANEIHLSPKVLGRFAKERVTKPAPLNEEIKVNELNVSVQREHTYSQQEQEILIEDGALCPTAAHEEQSDENLNESIHGLSEKIDLGLSLDSLSQKLNTSAKVVEYVDYAARSSESVALEAIRMQAMKNIMERDLNFDTQEYERMVLEHQTQAENIAGSSQRLANEIVKVQTKINCELADFAYSTEDCEKCFWRCKHTKHRLKMSKRTVKTW